MCQRSSYGPWCYKRDHCHSFLVQALDRTRYSKERMVMGRTSIMVFVTSFFFGVTIFAILRESGHSVWPERKSFQRSTSFCKRSCGTHVSLVVSIHNILQKYYSLSMTNSSFQLLQGNPSISREYFPLMWDQFQASISFRTYSSWRFQYWPQSRMNEVWSCSGRNSFHLSCTWVLPG